MVDNVYTHDTQWVEDRGHQSQTQLYNKLEEGDT